MIQVLGNARLISGAEVDVVVEAGLVVEHVPAGSRPPTVDLEGRLLLPAFCEPHAHLDKALTADVVPNPAGDLMGAIEAWSQRYHERTTDEIHERASRAIGLALAAGATSVRTHVDVGAEIGQRGVDALTRLRGELTDVDLQVVALVNCPMSGPEGAHNRASLAAAIESGVDLIGGCPHLEDDSQGLIDVVLDAAIDAGVGVDLHVDETLDPDMLSLRLLARSVLGRGFTLPVTASHCVSLSMQEPQVQREVAGLVAEADIGVVALPQTNLFLQARGVPTAPARGITPLGVLRDAGVRIAAGGDNVQDPFNPMGRGDPLETASLAVTAAHQSAGEAFDLITRGARDVVGAAAAGPEVGQLADCVAFDAQSTREVMASAPHDRLVFKAGRLVSGGR